jgi:hypothetical protein
MATFCSLKIDFAGRLQEQAKSYKTAGAFRAPFDLERLADWGSLHAFMCMRHAETITVGVAGNTGEPCTVDYEDFGGNGGRAGRSRHLPVSRVSYLGDCTRENETSGGTR